MIRLLVKYSRFPFIALVICGKSGEKGGKERILMEIEVETRSKPQISLLSVSLNWRNCKVGSSRAAVVILN
jgi:hypothetical protein